jgi:hypothetical protein
VERKPKKKGQPVIGWKKDDLGKDKNELYGRSQPFMVNKP